MITILEQFRNLQFGNKLHAFQIKKKKNILFSIHKY